MKHALTILSAALVLGLASCHPGIKPVMPNVGQQAPAKKPSASPLLDDARRSSGKADQQAAVSAEQLNKAQQNASEAQKLARAAREDADRLVKQKTATEEDLRKQLSFIDALNIAMDHLEVDLAQTAASLVKEKALRTESSALLERAQNLVRDKDSEADILRSQLAQAADQRDAYYQAADQNAKAAMTAQGQLEAAHGATRVWRNIAIGATAAAALLLLIFVILPLTRKLTVGV